MPPATVAQCVVLLGNSASDAGDPRPAVSNALLPCGDRPCLAWLMRELMRFGVRELLLPAAGLSEAARLVVASLTARLPLPVRIVVEDVPADAGAGGALWHLRDRLDRRFLLCDGGILVDANLATLLADGAGDEAGPVGRLLLCGSVDGGRRAGRSMPPGRLAGFALPCEPLRRAARRDPAAADAAPGPCAGIALFDRMLIDHLSSRCSLTADVLPRLAATGAVLASRVSGCFHDIDSRAGLALGRRHMPARLRRRALFLDRDGVINVDHGYIGSRGRFDWMPGAREAMAHATRSGWHVFIVTNQSGVARGYYNEVAVQALHAWIDDEVRLAGGTVDDMRYCPFHPEASVAAYRGAHPWRKPQPGMLLDLIRTWELDPARCVMVGDQRTDLQAAAAAGVDGHLFPGGDLLDFVRPILAKVS